MNGDQLLQLAFTLVGGGGLFAGLGALVLVRKQGRKLTAETGKTDADAATTLTDTAIELLTPLREEVADLRAQVRELTNDGDNLRGKLARATTNAGRLERQLQGALVEVAELRDANNRYRALHGPLPS